MARDGKLSPTFSARERQFRDRRKSAITNLKTQPLGKYWFKSLQTNCGLIWECLYSFYILRFDPKLHQKFKMTKNRIQMAILVNNSANFGYNHLKPIVD